MHREKFKLSFPVTDVCLLDKEVTIGSETFAPGRDKYYFTFTLLHSYPDINANGATFAYPLLKRFIPTAVNSPIDVEHEIEGSPLYAGENRIVGAIVKADIADLDDNELLPQEGQPVICIGVLWGRLNDVRAIVDDLSSGLEWKVSMEVDRDMDQDVFLVGEEVINQASDEWDAIYGAWVQGKTYKDNKIGLALGGTGLEKDDYASFFGAGMVMRAADEEAKIHDLQIAPAATATKDPRQFIGIAVSQRESIAADTPKVTIVSDGDLHSTVAKIMGTEISGFDCLNFTVEDMGDGYPYFNMAWSKYQTGEDGITEITHWYYDPTIGNIVQGKRKGGVMELKEIKQLIAESEAKFEGYMSPEDFASAVETVKVEYEGYLSPEAHQAKVDEAIANAFAEKDLQDQTYAQRDSALIKAGLEITDERKAKARRFALTEEGDREFDNWVATLKTGQDDMLTAMRKAGLEVGDEVKKSIAALDGADDPRFQVAVAMNLATRGRVVDTPAGAVDGDDEEMDLSAI